MLHPHSDPMPVAERLTSWARSHGKQVIADARDAARLPADVERVGTAQLVEQADALISLGGDGTMLGALRLVADRPIPILGVNLGNRDFLVEVEPDELDAVIVSPVAPISGISRPAVISAAEPIALSLVEGSGRPVLQVDGTIGRRVQPGEALEVRLRPRAGLVVRLDPERYQRRAEVKLSLMDLPFLPEEMRDLAPAFSGPAS